MYLPLILQHLEAVDRMTTADQLAIVNKLLADGEQANTIAQVNHFWSDFQNMVHKNATIFIGLL